MSNTIPNLLALDTASSTCSVALQWQGEVFYEEVQAQRQHNQQILPMIERLLSAAGASLSQLDAIAFGRGPGSFVGARLAASVTQGLAYGADLPVIAVSSLAIMAQTAYRQQGWTQVVIGVDGHMNAVYSAPFQCAEGLMVALQEEQAIAPLEWIYPVTEGWVAVGDAWAAYGLALPAALHNGTDQGIFPCAIDALALATAAYQRGECLTVQEAIPVYLRGASLWRKSAQPVL